MADIQTVWDTTNCVGDYALKDGSLQAGKDVETAILISLFTDRIADINDELPDATNNTRNDRRGWWGDTGQAYPIGSRLYLLDRRKAPLFVEKDAVNYATEALQWMIDDNAHGAIGIVFTNISDAAAEQRIFQGWHRDE